MEMNRKYFADLGMVAMLYQTLLDQGFDDEGIDEEIPGIAEELEIPESKLKELLVLVRGKVNEGISIIDEVNASLRIEERVDALVKERGGVDGISDYELKQIYEEELDKIGVMLDESMPDDIYGVIRDMFRPE